MERSPAGSVPWALPVARTRPCCSACARTIHATPPCLPGRHRGGGWHRGLRDRVSPVIDPLGRYLYAKGLRQDVTPPAGFAERVVPMHDQYWQTEEAMAEGPSAYPGRWGAHGLPPVLCLVRTTRRGIRAGPR